MSGKYRQCQLDA